METFKRVVSLLLCFVMLVGVVPFGAMATETTEPETTEVAPVVEEVTDSTDPTGETEEVTDEEHQPAVQAEGETEAKSNEVTLDGKTTTTKTAYVRTDSISANNSYLIVDGNGNILMNNSGSVGNVKETIKTDKNNKSYIELSDTTSTTSVLWKVASGFTFQNQSKYLYRASSGGTTPRIDSSSTNWSYNTSNHRLSYTRNGTTYYLYYDNGWKVTSTASNASSIYFYQSGDVTVETGSSVTYTMRAEDLTKYVTASSKTAKLDFCLQGNGTDLTTLPSGGSYNFIYDEANGIFTVDASGNVTFTGTYGSASVKVAYTWTQNGQNYTVYKYVTVTAQEPGYTLDITKGGEVVTGSTISVKGVTSTTTLNLGPKICLVDADGSTEVALPAGATLTWDIPAEYQNIATVNENGKVTFKGVSGAFYVTATLMTADGQSKQARVDISATVTSYSVPSDGTTDFPEYPNEGAIRYDKTAQAVGTFSQTGIAKMELSMTGVPYTTGSEIDVVIMLDRSSSMAKTSELKRIEATVAATKQFIKNIVINKDGTYNGNRILVADFLGGNLKQGQSHQYQSNLYTNDEQNGYQVVDSEAELNQLFDRIDSGFKGQSTLYGTEYAKGLQDCYNALQKSKADGNQQFCVFMSDGIPNYFQGEKTHFETTSDIVKMFSTSNTSSANATVSRSNTAYEYERYSTMMKNNGVTVYTVGLGLLGTNSSWSGASAQACEKVANILLNDISGPAGETAADRDTGSDINKLNKYFFSVADTNAVEDMKDVFANIAMQIMQAATDVTVEDQITDEYTMIFDIPTGHHEITGVDGQEFYIEFLKYALDEDHERTNNVTSMAKLYLHKSGNTYVAASDKNGTAYASPVFQQKPIGDKGTLYYWTTDASKGDTGVSVKVGNTTYYFVSYGLESGYNMTSGAFASGTVNATTNMSTDLIIATPYFVYNANTKMLYWTVDKLDTYEYVLNYFLYLDNSATEVGVEGKETPAGTYPTNDHAYITYTNFKGNDCRQEFPIPQMTWNGAQVSYVFYLVNAQGQPINKAGQVVDFANATFVTSVYTTAVVWNKGLDGTSEGSTPLSIDWLANELLPSDYMIYDEAARYQLNVHEKEDGTTIKNQFTISGGTADAISSSLNSRLKLGTTANTVSTSTTKVYNTKAGNKYTAYGTYTSSQNEMKGFDFANTTVAFAVVWQPKLVEDTVVVDFGLDVLIDVVQNDLLQNTVDGIAFNNSNYGNIAMNTAVADAAKFSKNDQSNGKYDISIENENQIRFSQKDMQFNEPVSFYYESAVDFYENSASKKGYMYSKVTVIPATTIYYEDSFVDLTVWDIECNLLDEKWAVVGDVIDATQAQDRPGESQISMNLDADNVYGYDGAYENCSTFSMGSARKVTVNSDKFAEAQFTFYGTGFDVLSYCSNATGTITVDVYYGTNVTYSSTNRAASYAVDTYYGMDENGNLSVNNPNALYQVPVMKVENLTYGQYTVVITAAYASLFDHNKAGSYDFYLDAIRIYDPANDGANSKVIEDAYKADGEGWPHYEELRNLVIDTALMDENSAEGATNTAINGVVFIDTVDGTSNIADYVSYGPNNELYLAPGQSIAFQLDQTYADKIADVQIAMKSANGNAVSYKMNNVVNGAETNAITGELNTATDLYYSIKTLKNNIIVISNVNEVETSENDETVTTDTTAIISITNIKFTFTEKPSDNGEIESIVQVSADMVAKVEAAMNAANKPEGDESEGDEPEIKFAPKTFEVKVTGKSVKAGQTINVKVTTSSDVVAITVEGEIVTQYKVDKKTGNRTWEAKILTDKNDAGRTETVEVVAYGEIDGNAVASEKKTVEVKIEAKPAPAKGKK